MTSQRYEYTGASTRSAVEPAYRRASEVPHRSARHNGPLPLLLLYILNGNHDPRKVQWLNGALAVCSFAGGLVVGWNLFPIGIAFVVIAAVNALNLWCLRRFTNYTPLVGPKDLLAEIQRRSGW